MKYAESLGIALEDIKRAIDCRSIWLALGWNDVRGRYHRSALGPIWAGLSLLILVSALAPVYSKLMSVDLQGYLFHLLLGFIVWNYVSACLSECGREFIKSKEYLISFQLGFFTLLMRVVWRNLVALGYQMIVFCLFAIIFGQSFQVAWFLVPLALVLITLNALWAGLLLAIVGTRFRDVDELVNNVMRLVFFVTPIMWSPGFEEELLAFAKINPFYHLIEIFRGPLVNTEIDWFSWLVVLMMTGLGWCVAIIVFVKFRRRIAFWL